MNDSELKLPKDRIVTERCFVCQKKVGSSKWLITVEDGEYYMCYRIHSKCLDRVNDIREKAIYP